MLLTNIAHDEPGDRCQHLSCDALLFVCLERTGALQTSSLWALDPAIAHVTFGSLPYSCFADVIPQSCYQFDMNITGGGGGPDS